MSKAIAASVVPATIIAYLLLFSLLHGHGWSMYALYFIGMTMCCIIGIAKELRLWPFSTNENLVWPLGTIHSLSYATLVMSMKILTRTHHWFALMAPVFVVFLGFSIVAQKRKWWPYQWWNPPRNG